MLHIEPFRSLLLSAPYTLSLRNTGLMTEVLCRFLLAANLASWMLLVNANRNDFIRYYSNISKYLGQFFHCITRILLALLPVIGDFERIL